MPDTDSAIVCSSANVEPVPVVTVTVAVPPFSAIVAGSTSSVSSGASSSSMIVSVASAGAATPSSDTTPDTRSVLSAVSTPLFTAVIVTSPVLSVAPAAKLSVPPDSAKSPATAGASGAAATVTVNGSVDAADSVAVTLPTPPSSPIESGLSTSVTSGTASSSSIVTVRPMPNASPL